jgi:hypothetical protein
MHNKRMRPGGALPWSRRISSAATERDFYTGFAKNNPSGVKAVQALQTEALVIFDVQGIKVLFYKFTVPFLYRVKDLRAARDRLPRHEGGVE